MKRIIIATFISISILIPHSALAIDEMYWKYFKPDKTTEDSILTLFGPPDLVKLHYSYEDFKKTKESGAKILFPYYVLNYSRFRGDLNILKGPLGEAAAVDVEIEDGVVIAVTWKYEVKYKTPAESIWQSSKNISTVRGPYITIGSNKIPENGILYITCTTGSNSMCDGLIDVLLVKEIEKAKTAKPKSR
jgi:hypothetical protein